MNLEQFWREKAYGAGLAIAGSLLERSLITRHEYRKIKTALIKQYRPVIGSIQQNASYNSLRNE